MAQEYTPGPWLVAPDDLEISIEGNDECGNVVSGWKVIGSEDYAFAVVVCDMGPPNCYDDEQLDADTRLIAAAPDLLEALKLIAAFEPKTGATKPSDRNMDNAWNRAGEYAAGIARAAIAKALGE